jgi:hypothetical protein
VRPEPTGQGGDFLARERALLGEDADLFTANDAKSNVATVQDGDDDLLGGDDDFTSAPAQPSGGAAANNDLDDFESSFPAIDTRNDVGSPHSPHLSTRVTPY